MTPVPGRRIVDGWSIRWDESRAEQARAQGFWPGNTAADFAVAAAAADPERVIIIDDRRRLTVAALVTEAQAVARCFVGRGLVAGDVVSIMLPNWHEATVIYLAAGFAGLVVNLILPNYRESEVVFTLGDCGSRMIFVPETYRKFDYVEMLRAVNANLARPVEVVVLRGDARGATAYETLATGFEDAALPRVDPDGVKLVMYTSGTTGRAKGVLHTHQSLAAAISQIRGFWHVEAGDRFFVPSPISHIGGSLYAFELPLMVGTSVVLQDVWDGEAAVAAIDREMCTHMAGATPFLQQILAAAAKAGTRLCSMKVFICGGASVPPSLVREATAHLESCIVSRVFGCTEVPMITIGTMTGGDVEHAAETDGRAGIARLKLVDPSGATAEAEGEVCALGAQMLLGYLRPEDEAGQFDGDGYFHTGDLGRWVDGEFLLITGRAKDIIIRNGENIAPKEIEDLLVLHPAIAEVSVVGLPDPRTGELACAVIVPAPGQTPTVEDVKTFLVGRQLARFKIPERVELRAALPRNAAGKVLKNRLRETLLNPALASPES